jgi:hypothetical protein
MKLRTIVPYVVLLFAGLPLSGCKEKLPRQKIPLPSSPQALQGAPSRLKRAPQRVQQPTGRPAAANTVAGLSWKIPTAWKLGPRKPMRLATYLIPGSSNATIGSCSVFYFGPRAGGVQANIDRWRKQFRFASKRASVEQVKQSKVNVGAIRVNLVTIEGTFLFSPRPMSATKIPKPNSVMLGAIVQAPKGPVFFKCVGPKATMLGAKAAFQKMMYSMKTQG